jgi:hypothetical protein
LGDNKVTLSVDFILYTPQYKTIIDLQIYKNDLITRLYIDTHFTLAARQCDGFDVQAT